MFPHMRLVINPPFSSLKTYLATFLKQLNLQGLRVATLFLGVLKEIAAEYLHWDTTIWWMVENISLVFILKLSDPSYCFISQAR